MRAPGYGEGQPRLDDDRVPIVLVVLDGLGDRPVPELGGATPAEAAPTPNLDALAARGCSGWHLPFGWGAAPASELAHWAMFGFASVPFPGRAVLEAAGAGIEIPVSTAVTHAALRTSDVRDGQVWITGRVAGDDGDDASALLAALAPVCALHRARMLPLGGRGESLLVLDGLPAGAVTDSDPFFEDRHPWLRVRACRAGGVGEDLPMFRTPDTDGGAERTADVLTALLRDARDVLRAHPVNAARTARGRPALDVLTTKWSGSREPLPPFAEQVGVAGAAVTSTRLYRGIAGLLGMAQRHLVPVPDPAQDIRARLAAAEELITDGAAFVHVHTKATDEAGHTKDPYAKRDVLAALDRGLDRLGELAGRAVVAVTGDHATPSTGGVLHTGDPTPLVVAGPTVRPDPVTGFGEAPAASGWYRTVRAAELLPLLLGHANRPTFLGHRPTGRRTAALPDRPEPMPGP